MSTTSSGEVTIAVSDQVARQFVELVDALRFGEISKDDFLRDVSVNNLQFLLRKETEFPPPLTEYEPEITRSLIRPKNALL